MALELAARLTLPALLLSILLLLHLRFGDTGSATAPRLRLAKSKTNGSRFKLSGLAPLKGQTIVVAQARLRAEWRAEFVQEIAKPARRARTVRIKPDSPDTAVPDRCRARSSHRRREKSAT